MISGLSVAVREGELVAVVGSSGSGKSLLAHAILGILPYNANVSGTMKFQGELMDEKKISELRGKGNCFRTSEHLISGSAYESGETGPGKKEGEKGQKSNRNCSAGMVCEETETKYPFECSGGMTRRILLSTALMENPKLIIADEPTPGMDRHLRKSLWRISENLQMKEMEFF